MLCVLVYMWLRPVPDVLVGARYMPLVNTGVKPLCGRNWRVAETFVVYVLCRNTDDRQMLAKNFYGGLGRGTKVQVARRGFIGMCGEQGWCCHGPAASRARFPKKSSTWAGCGCPPYLLCDRSVVGIGGAHVGLHRDAAGQQYTFCIRPGEARFTDLVQRL